MKKLPSMLLLLAMAALSLQACAPTTQTPDISNELAKNEARLQRELAVKENMAAATRLHNIAEKIMLANTELCGDMVTPYLGVEFATKDSFNKEYQQTMADLYGVGEYPTITMIGKNGPAAKKLKIGDMITHVNNEPMPEGKKSLKAFSDAVKNSEAAQTLALSIDRAGKPVSVNVRPKLACDSPVRLSATDQVNAFANGEMIAVTKGMMRFVENDTELATIIGHELAHNTREHIDAKRGNAVLGGILGAVVSVAIGVNVTDIGAQLGAGANSQDFEAEADYVGLYHAARAGYDITNAPNVWRRIAASNPDAIHLAGSTHPSTAKRFLALEATVKEIKAKKAAGKKLVPEEKQVDNSANNKSDLNG